MASPTPAQLANQMSTLITRWREYTDQMKAWLGGGADGGPDGDGRFPLTDAFGVTHLVLCPAGQEAQVNSVTDGTAADAAAAQAAAQAAAHSAQEAQAAAETSFSYITASQEARDLAQLYADHAGTHAANAAVLYRNLSQVRLDTDGGVFEDSYHSLMNHIDGGHVTDVYEPTSHIFDGGTFE